MNLFYSEAAHSLETTVINRPLMLDDGEHRQAAFLGPGVTAVMRSVSDS